MPKFTDNTGKAYSCILLQSKSDYKVWAYTMTEHLKTAGLYQLVTGIPQEGPSSDTKTDLASAQQAKSLLLSVIGPLIIESVLHCTTAYEIWQHLEKSLGSKSGDEQLDLMAELNSFNCQSSLDVAGMVTKALAIKGKLIASGIPVPDVLVISAITRALPDEYKGFLHGWKLFDKEYKTLARFVEKLLDETRDLSKDSQTAQVALVNRGQGPVRNLQPNRTNYQSGYNAYNRNRQFNPRPDMGRSTRPAPVPNNVCNYCRKVGHWKVDCRKRKARLGQNSEVMFMALIEVPGGNQNSEVGSSWIADSGCSAHMTPNKEWLSNYQVCQQAVRVRLGNNSYLSAIGFGRIKTNMGVLSKVYHVPGLGSNLFSIAEATSNKLAVHFHADHISFVKEGRVVLRGVKKGGTYLIELEIIEPEEEEALAATLDEWHRRLAHLPKEVINKMIKSEAVKGLQLIEKETDVCADCKLNKCRRASHKTRSTPRVLKAGQSLHLDVIGPIKQEGLGNQRFILTCRDEFSGYRMVACLKSKGQVPEMVKAMINQTELQTRNMVLKLTTDNGSEFASERLGFFCQYKGIHHTLSAPYVPQQNGMAERENQQVLNQARTVLNGAKLPLELWPEAVLTTTYVANRCLSKKRDVTPYELWTGLKPDIKNLKIFGQHASVLRPENQRGKFDLKGQRMVFVGYTENFQTYRFLDPASKRIITACDACFLNEVGPIGDDGIHSSETIDLQIPGTSGDTDLEKNPPGEAPETRTASGNTSQFLSFTESSGEVMNEGSEEARDESISRAEQGMSTPTPPSFHCDRGGRASLETPVFQSLDSYPRESSQPMIPQAPIVSRLRPRERVNYSDLAKGQTNLSAKLALTSMPPSNYVEIQNRDDYQIWQRACDEEYQSMLDNNVFKLVNPDGHHVVGSRWVFSWKSAPNGNQKAKARLVAQGFTQIEGVDYFNTFAPVVHMDAVRLLLAIKASLGLSMLQFDISTAFLNGNLREQVLMQQPTGYTDGTNRVWLLTKSIYGLKQAPRMWNERFSEFLATMGFKSIEGEPCIFIRAEPLAYIALYVDDAIVLGETEDSCNQVIEGIGREFKVHKITSKRFLGFQYKEEEGSVIIYQQDYIEKLLQRNGMWEANSAPTPMVSGQKEGEEIALESNEVFREIVGGLLYASCQTRPDIAFTVNYLGRKVTNPTQADWAIMKRCLRYLKGTMNLGIRFSSGKSQELKAFCDADYAGDKGSYKSTNGQIIFYGTSPIAWKSKLQKSVVTSTTEAEFMAVSSTIKTVKYLRNILAKLGIDNKQPTIINCDNKGAVAIVSDQASAQRTRHLGAQLAFAREQHAQEIVKVQHIPGRENLADMLTKPLSTEKFQMNRAFIMSMIILTMIGTVAQTMGANLAIVKKSSIVWIPMNTRSEIGRSYFEVTLKMEDRCKSAKDKFDNVADESSFQSYAAHRVVAHCEEMRDRLVSSLLKELVLTYNPRSKRAVTLDMNELPDHESKSAWSIFYDGFPFVNSLVQYFDKNSEHNTMPKLVRTTKQLAHVINSTLEKVDLIKEALQASTNYNKANMNALEEVVKAMNKTSSEIGPISVDLLEANMLISRIDNELLEDRELVFKLMRSFQDGHVDIESLAKRFESCNNLMKYKNSDTTFTNFVLKNAAPTIQFNTPVYDPSSTIYESKSFKEWLNESTYYELLDFPQYSMFNSSSNCSRYLDVDESQLSYETCTEKDKPLDLSRFHHITRDLIRVPYDQRGRHLYPTVIKSKELMYVQCYNHIYVLETDGSVVKEKCPKEVFAILQSSSIQVANITHKATRISHELKQALENQDKGSLAKFINPWQPNMDLVMSSIANMKAETLKQEEAINKIEQLPDYQILVGLAQKYPERTGVIVIASIMVLTTIYVKFRKNDLVGLVEATVLANLERNQLNNMSDQDRGKQAMPNININVHNNRIGDGSEMDRNWRPNRAKDKASLRSAHPSGYSLSITHSTPRLYLEN